MSSFDTSAAGTVNFPLKKSQKLPQKLASHWGDSQIKIESFWPQKNEAQIDVPYSCFRGWPAGRPAGREKGFISTVVLEKRPSAAKKGVKQVIRDVSVELST